MREDEKRREGLEGQIVTTALYGKMQKGATVNWTATSHKLVLLFLARVSRFFFLRLFKLSQKECGKDSDASLSVIDDWLSRNGKIL